MRKIVKIGFPILCVAIVGGTLIGIRRTQKTIEQLQEYANSVNETNTSSVENSYIENEENILEVDNETSNSVNNVTNSTNSSVNNTSNNTYTDNTENSLN